MPNLRLSSGNALTLILSLSMGCGSCWFQKPPSVFTPPAAQAAPAPAAKIAPPVALPAPPQIRADVDSTEPPMVPTAIPETPAPPAARPAPRRGNPAPAVPKPATPPAPADTTAPPPRLGQIFTPEQMREHNRAIDESLDRVRRALAVLSQKRLNPQQSETVNRIATFQKQAEQAREGQDLANAELLAKRAELLAQDLLTRVP